MDKQSKNSLSYMTVMLALYALRFFSFFLNAFFLSSASDMTDLLTNDLKSKKYNKILNKMRIFFTTFPVLSY